MLCTNKWRNVVTYYGRGMKLGGGGGVGVSHTGVRLEENNFMVICDVPFFKISFFFISPLLLFLLDNILSPVMCLFDIVRIVLY